MSGDILENFEVMAGWRNDGTADLYLSCRVCDWWFEWRADGNEGRAALVEVVDAANQHWSEGHLSAERSGEEKNHG